MRMREIKMGTPSRRRRCHKSDKHIRKKYRTKRKTKDIDQVLDDLQRPLPAVHDVDVPGAGQHFCLTCSRHFIDNDALLKHYRSKLHKRRLRRLADPVYSQKEAERAAGHGSYY